MYLYVSFILVKTFTAYIKSRIQWKNIAIKINLNLEIRGTNLKSIRDPHLGITAENGFDSSKEF